MQARALCSAKRLAALLSQKRRYGAYGFRGNPKRGSRDVNRSGSGSGNHVEPEHRKFRGGRSRDAGDTIEDKEVWRHPPASSAPINGRVYAEWGKVKYRNRKEDREEMEKKETDPFFKEDVWPRPKTPKVAPSGKSKVRVSKLDVMEYVKSQANSGENEENDDVGASSGWCASYRDRFEEALVEKGLISESEKNTVHPRAVSEGEDVEEPDTECESDLESEVQSEDEEESEDEADAEDDDDDAGGEDEEEDEDVENFHVEQQTRRDASGDKRSATTNAQALIDALDDEPDAGVHEKHQKLLKAAIVGAPNAGKSCLLNYLIGTKVSAVSRKTNTTRSEILGVLTEGDTQILFYDTPGLMVDWKGQAVRQDTRNRVQSAWMVTNHCDVVIVLVDAHRQIQRPDERVKRLIDKIGAKAHPTQKRVLCLNKVDLIRCKRDLVPLAQELGGLPGFNSVFMISGLRGGGVRHLKEFLLDQADYCPWEEEQGVVTDMNPVMIAKEVVWEHVLDNVHQEIPYEMKHKHISWKVLRDQSIRIEQQLVVQTENQKKILVGKKGALIRKIGMAANEELCTRLGRKVHLMLDVKIASSQNIYAPQENIPDEMWI